MKIGLGCMAMSGVYGATDDATSIRTIHAAIESGVTLLDTGDFYGMGHNEMLIGRAIQGKRDRVQLSVKFGALRGPDGSWLGFDARSEAVKNFLAYSLKRLGVDYVDLYRPGRVDPAVPIEETVGAIAEMVKAGYVKKIGLSEVAAETTRRAQAVHPIADVQIEYSIASRGPEASLFPALHEMGVGATLYGVYSRGLLTGSKPAGRGDWRGWMPRFDEENRRKNDEVVRRLDGFARDKKMTTAQLLLAWVLAKEPRFMPLVGAKTEAHLRDALGALDKPLSAADLAALDQIAPASSFSGERYPAQLMQTLDSER